MSSHGIVINPDRDRRLSLLVMGNITLDYVADVDRLPMPGKTSLIRNAGLYPGGRGANVAVIASKLGLSVDLASFVGEDFPESYRRDLEKSKINLSKIRKVAGARCARFFAFRDPDGATGQLLEPIILARQEELALSARDVRKHSGTYVTPLDSDRHIVKLQDALMQSKNVFLSLGEEVYRKTPERLQCFLRSTHYLFMNQHEFSDLSAILAIKSPGGMFKLAPRLLALIVTEEEKGCKAWTRQKVLSVPAIPTKKRTELGGGDAFAAGFIFSILSGSSILDGMRMATTIASIALEGNSVQSAIVDWRKIKRKYSSTFGSLPVTRMRVARVNARIWRD